MSEQGERMQEAITEAISNAFASTGDGSMVTKWVALVEVLTPEGDRGVWTFTNPEAKNWDTMGLLMMAVDMERADVIAERLARNEE